LEANSATLGSDRLFYENVYRIFYEIKKNRHNVTGGIDKFWRFTSKGIFAIEYFPKILLEQNF
jgi:hypothetical protein